MFRLSLLISIEALLITTRDEWSTIPPVFNNYNQIMLFQYIDILFSVFIIKQKQFYAE